jgi:hypothetical protein
LRRGHLRVAPEFAAFVSFAGNQCGTIVESLLHRFLRLRIKRTQFLNLISGKPSASLTQSAKLEIETHNRARKTVVGVSTD